MSTLQQTFDFFHRADGCELGASLCSAWMDYAKPFWWRRNQLQKEADRIAQTKIVYRSGKYGPSLMRANKARDEYYQAHESELWPNDKLTCAGNEKGKNEHCGK